MSLHELHELELCETDATPLVWSVLSIFWC